MLTVLCCLCTGLVFGETGLKKLVLNFYGHMLQFDLDGDFYSQRKKIFNDLTHEEKAILLINDSQVHKLVAIADEYAEQLNLDGMAYLMLVQKVSAKISKGDEAFAVLFTYAALNKKGMDVLLAANENRMTLYGSTTFNIKNVLYVVRNGKVYYDLSFDQGKEPMNEQLINLPVAADAKPISLNKYSPPSLTANAEVKTIPFEYESTVYFFTIHLNQSLVAYYNDLPGIEISKIYLNYGLSEKGNHTLVEQLKDATSYMSKEKVVNFILAFIQSLDYAKDAEVLGKEKFAFPEESMANDYTDCEDRSMLFAYLVREVAHLQSVGLLYTNSSHMNVAVESWKKKEESDFNVYEMDFVVCEPSGKGFKAGQQTMDVSMARVVKW